MEQNLVHILEPSLLHVLEQFSAARAIHVTVVIECY
jgi:hypothetical protein